MGRCVDGLVGRWWWFGGWVGYVDRWIATGDVIRTGGEEWGMKIMDIDGY